MKSLMLILVLALMIPWCVSAATDTGTDATVNAENLMQPTSPGVRARTDIQQPVPVPTMMGMAGVPMGSSMMNQTYGQTMTGNYMGMMGTDGQGMMGGNYPGMMGGNYSAMMGGSSGMMGMGTCPMMDGMMSGGGCGMMGGSGMMGGAGMMGGSGYGMMGDGMGWGMGSSDPWALYLGWLYRILVLVLILVWTGAGIMVFLYFRKKMP